MQIEQGLPYVNAKVIVFSRTYRKKSLPDEISANLLRGVPWVFAVLCHIDRAQCLQLVNVQLHTPEVAHAARNLREESCM